MRGVARGGSQRARLGLGHSLLSMFKILHKKEQETNPSAALRGQGGLLDRAAPAAAVRSQDRPGRAPPDGSLRRAGTLPVDAFLSGPLLEAGAVALLPKNPLSDWIPTQSGSPSALGRAFP